MNGNKYPYPLPPRRHGHLRRRPLTERNNQRHDLLGGSELTQAEITRWKRVLSEWWGIRNKQDLLKALEWIDRGGHRKDFEKLGAYVALLNDNQLEEALVKAGQDGQSKHELDTVINYYGKFHRQSLLAWDYGRYITLCRWGYLVGNLTEEEAWSRIMPPAIKLQETFESWNELGENYLVGREFWSYEQTKRDGQLYRDAYQYLLDASGSPWNLNPWKMQLGLSNH